ncbi:CPBP family intramembrane metalloprotease [Corynebacterium felinum]|uniref:Membrane protease YdiL (CAAX protease family) n=1 Tax=Corynebacterium felinum TaxID=131318 RepID=A0ABU2BAP1_9CORY|nr:CPBP family intramembrane glutamic endopeptidase [Corynebacterium felinum]MDF5821830.1 CPBP family intramembrane metalloprotease [Corynebacterium felinum]MDR7355361.1 membrane protease YdiL (CAAX protease family) [Corynebacterium felinum]WJY94713.1 CAAX amino terminal protease self- immunity [Corynebacterium felinum]
MIEFVIWVIPSFIYAFVQKRKREWESILHSLGATWGDKKSHAIGLGIFLLVCVLSAIVFQLMPEDVFGSLGDSFTRVTSIGAGIVIALRAFGEEVFFRGFLGGFLMRRLGFLAGNTLQAVIFLLPHLSLLILNTGLCPIVVLQFFLGWVLGWLRHYSGSFLPGAVAHMATNIAVTFLV